MSSSNRGGSAGSAIRPLPDRAPIRRRDPPAVDERPASGSYSIFERNW